MKYLIGIMLIGLIASCSSTSDSKGAWIIKNLDTGAPGGMTIKMNTKTGETYTLIKGKWYPYKLAAPEEQKKWEESLK